MPTGVRYVPGGDTPNRDQARLTGPRRWVVASLRTGAALVVVAVVVKVGVDNASSLRRVHLRITWPWLVPAALASLGGGLLMPLGWKLLISAFGPTMPATVALRVWWTAQITRYVPTGAAALATRVALAAREGVPRVLAGGSLPVEVAIIVGWGAVLTGALIPDRLLPAPARLAIGAAGAVGLVCLPYILRHAGRLIRWLPDPLAGPAGRRPIYAAEGLYGLNSGVRTLAFLFLMEALLPAKADELALLAGAFNASAVAGLVSVAPGGLGVREGILTLILRGRFGFGEAAAAAVVLRGWDLAVDLVWLVSARMAGRVPRETGSLSQVVQRDRPPAQREPRTQR